MVTHIAENTHWYAPDGTPVYEVPRAKGDGTRATTLADARKMGLVPGVTGIIGVVAAPALERWKRNQTLLAALTLPRIDGEADLEFCARVHEDAAQHAKEAADKGSQIHAAIQGWIESLTPDDKFGSLPEDPEMLVHVKGVQELLDPLSDRASWRTEVACVHPLGYGTKADLIHAEGRWLIDFKGKDFDDPMDKGLATYSNHWMQLAATRAAMAQQDEQHQNARCAICYVSRSTPGLAVLVDVKEDKLQRGWRMFQAALELWKAQKDYDPAEVFTR